MMTILKDALTRFTVPELKDLTGYLPGGDVSGRKDQLVERLAAALLGSELKPLWASLDETQQTAVAEAVHHPHGEYSEQRFRAKYQKAPVFRIAGKSYGYSSDKCSELCLFIHYSHDDRRYFVPADLRVYLRAFVAAPAAVWLAASETPGDAEGLTIRLTEREALQEVVVMLRTIDQTRVQVSDKTALAGAATLRQLTEKLAGGDFYPWVEKTNKWDQEIGPIKAFAWPLLLQAGGLAANTGGRLSLSPAGNKALAAAPADALRGLWRKWQKNTLIDEFSRIDAIKGQNSKGRVMTAIAPRRAAIEATLRECPVGYWVLLDDFSRFMQATDRRFEVTHDLWKLYISDREYGSLGYGVGGDWSILQGRYIATLLFEYAATLGMVDLAYFDPQDGSDDYREIWGTDEMAFLSRYDGLNAIRLTPLGAYVLGLTDAYQPAAITSDVVLAVMPGLQVKVVRGALAVEETLLLENWAVAVEAGVWRLDRAKSLEAIEKGGDIDELQHFLESRDDVPLPETVESFLRLCKRNGQALKIAGSAVLIECRDAETAAAIAAHKETAALCLPAGTKTLVVRANQLDKFHEWVRLLGYGIAQ